MINERRMQRIRDVLGRRLGRVRCAVEAVYHRHNVSAVLRTCDSLGLQHVHLVEGRFHPSKGAARGADRWLDIHREPSAAAAMAHLKEQGFRVYVADLVEGALPPERIPVEEPVCLWFGAEVAGVSEEATALADGAVMIPMRGFAQSLNISVAAAVALRPVAERARALGREALLTEEERAALWARWQEREYTLRNGVVARQHMTPWVLE